MEKGNAEIGESTVASTERGTVSSLSTQLTTVVLTPGQPFPYTHEFLGMRRVLITLALGAMERAGIIETGRGKIVVRERAALEALPANSMSSQKLLLNPFSTIEFASEQTNGLEGDTFRLEGPPEAPRILIVEDDTIIAADLQSILKTNGYTIVGNVRTGYEAIQIAKAEQPDLIILDILLADRMSGIEVSFIVESALRKRIPIIYLTALHKDDFPELGDQFHQRAFITKPFREEDLVTTVNKILKR